VAHLVPLHPGRAAYGLDRLDQLGLTCTIEEASEILGLSRVAAYRSAARFRATNGAMGLPNIKLAGHKLLVPVPALRRWLETGLPPDLEGNGNGKAKR
jgi:hypothetical protein